MSKLEPTRTYSNPTATDVLRRLLDERGVEWGNIRNDGSESDYLTEWQFENNQGKAIAIEWAVGSGLSVEIHRYHRTPAQAIAATLGATDAKPTQAESSGTCHDVWDVELTGRLRFQCSECGAVSLAITPRFCPACGRKVVEPTKNDVDAEVERMSITDELREWFKDRFFMANGWQEIHDIADRIDAEHQKALDEWKAEHGQMWLKGYSECHAELLEGNETLASDLERCGWIRMPKDADGEYVHIDDVMEWPDGKTFEVVGIGEGTLFYVEDGSECADWTGASTKRHHHAPTVEDVLREFAYGLGVPVADSYVAATAAKLRLAEGEDA